MNLWKALWNDESGMILSAEAALLGTVGVIGATVGLSAAARSINEELTEVAASFRSLDQSYAFEGQRSPHAWTAGSSYQQTPVAESQRALREQVQRHEQELERKEKELKREHRKDRNRRKEEARKAETDPVGINSVDTEWKIDGVADAI